MTRTIIIAATLLLAGSLAGAAFAAPTAAQKCSAAVVTGAGKYAACQHKAFARSRIGATWRPDRCVEKLEHLWARLQAKYAGTGTVCEGLRYTDNGATVTDNLTGLEWEKKTSLDDVANLADPHDADNAYDWSATGAAADGPAFTDFLAALNTPPCFQGHCDWRLPSKDELQTILTRPCSAAPCIDPALGPTPDSIVNLMIPFGSNASLYWSATSFPPDPSGAWVASFSSPITTLVATKKQVPEVFGFPLNIAVRAVRGGW